MEQRGNGGGGEQGQGRWGGGGCCVAGDGLVGRLVCWQSWGVGLFILWVAGLRGWRDLEIIDLQWGWLAGVLMGRLVVLILCLPGVGPDAEQ